MQSQPDRTPEYYCEGELFQIAKKLKQKGVFIGGPLGLFESVGRGQLVILLKNGLYPYHKVLDVGCGLLRGGYWIINFLDPSCYYGIEPNQKVLETGITTILGKELLERKRPHFDFNDEFNFNCFGVKFDFVIARSVWTHASKMQIAQMLDAFIEAKTQHGIFLASYLRPIRRAFDARLKDYKGIEWVGQSHKSRTLGTIRHDFEFIKKECRERNLNVREIKDEVMNSQIWLRIG